MRFSPNARTHQQVIIGDLSSLYATQPGPQSELIELIRLIGDRSKMSISLYVGGSAVTISAANAIRLMLALGEQVEFLGDRAKYLTIEEGVFSR